jgi:hypothetical protein
MCLACMRGTGLAEWRLCRPMDHRPDRPEGHSPCRDCAGLWIAIFAGLRGMAQQTSCRFVDHWPSRPEGHGPSRDPAGLWSMVLVGAKEQGQRIRDPMACGAAAPWAYGVGLGKQHRLFC